MASSLHGSARTTPRVRAELQASLETTNVLAQRYGLSRTTVNKWRARTTASDAPMGPTDPILRLPTIINEECLTTSAILQVGEMHRINSDTSSLPVLVTKREGAVTSNDVAFRLATAR